MGEQYLRQPGLINIPKPPPQLPAVLYRTAEQPSVTIPPSNSAIPTSKMSSPYGNLSAEVQSALDTLNSDDSQYQPHAAHEIFKLEQAVQIFFITIDGQVSSFSAPETLRIFQFLEESEGTSIMFPDIYSEASGCSVGLVLIDTLVSEDQKKQLMTLLEQHTALKTNEQLPAEDQLGRVGSSIVWGAEKLAEGIEMGAEKAGVLIEYVTEAAEKRLSKTTNEDA